MRFLDALAPEDRVAVIQFNGKGVKTLLDFTTKRRDTAYAITTADGKGDTFFYKALEYSLKQLGKEGKRRKAIVVMTDGVDTELRKADTPAARNGVAEDPCRHNPTPPTGLPLSCKTRSTVVPIFPLALPSGDSKRLAFLRETHGR